MAGKGKNNQNPETTEPEVDPNAPDAEGDELESVEAAPPAAPEPFLAQLRADHEMFNMETKFRHKLPKGTVLSSQEYDMDLLIKQGAQLDLVSRNEKGKLVVEGDLTPTED